MPVQCLTMKAYGVDWGQLPAEVQESLDEDMRKLEKKVRYSWLRFVWFALSAQLIGRASEVPTKP